MIKAKLQPLVLEVSMIHSSPFIWALIVIVIWSFHMDHKLLEVVRVFAWYQKTVH